MDLFGIVDERSCSVALTGRDKESVLSELAELIAGVTAVSKVEVLNSLLERERAGSTGFEEGVAIPHARIRGFTEFKLAIAISKRGVDFDSVDGKKTRLFFVLVGPEEDPQEYLKLLAQISRVGLKRAARDEILKAPTRLAVREAFLRHAGTNAPRSSTEVRQQMLFVVLSERRHLDAVAALFVEHGINGASVVESTGIRNILTTVPLFGDFLDFLGERSDVSTTIMTVVQAARVESIVNGIEAITGDLDTHTGAAVFALDIAFGKGSLEVI